MALTRWPLPAKDLDDLQEYATLVLANLSDVFDRHEVHDHEETIYALADAMKSFAGEYHRLVQEGKVPKEQMYKLMPEGGNNV